MKRTVKDQIQYFYGTDHNVRGVSQRNQPGFADKTTDGSDNRYWILRNMGRVF